MKYDLILFDLDNTLICFETAQKNALEKVLIQHNYPYSQECLNRFQSINDQLWHSFEKQKITKDEVFITRFRMLLQNASERVCREINEEFLEYLSERPVTLPGVEGFLREIEGRCISGIVTNGDSRVQKKKLKELPYKSQFEFMVISEEVGAPKPSSKIFQEALRQAARFGWKEAGSVLMVGDNLNADIQGALGMGFDACWYNPVGKKCPQEIEPTLAIQNFDELLDFLNQ